MNVIFHKEGITELLKLLYGWQYQIEGIITH